MMKIVAIIAGLFVVPAHAGSWSDCRNHPEPAVSGCGQTGTDNTEVERDAATLTPQQFMSDGSPAESSRKVLRIGVVRLDSFLLPSRALMYRTC